MFVSVQVHLSIYLSLSMSRSLHLILSRFVYNPQWIESLSKIKLKHHVYIYIDNDNWWITPAVSDMGDLLLVLLWISDCLALLQSNLGLDLNLEARCIMLCLHYSYKTPWNCSKQGPTHDNLMTTGMTLQGSQPSMMNWSVWLHTNRS
jgi:hypothetical protein